MQQSLQQFYQSCLDKNHFVAVPTNQKEGNDYAVNSQYFEGDYWYYCHRNLFSICTHDFTVKEDVFVNQKQPSYLSIYYYQTVEAYLHPAHSPIESNSIYCNVSDNEAYQVHFKKGSQLKSISMYITPVYFEQFIQPHYGFSYEESVEVFRRMKNPSRWSDFITLMLKIGNYQGTGVAARLFYEGMVAEALALMITNHQAEQKYQRKARCSRDDEKMLEKVVHYIDGHLHEHLRLSQLAAIACMGVTSLKVKFKKRYECTITSFIQKKRISYAQKLLLTTDLLIGQIAVMVGYHNASRFTELFRKHTGFLPSEYRETNQSMSNDIGEQ